MVLNIMCELTNDTRGLLGSDVDAMFINLSPRFYKYPHSYKSP